MSDDGDQIAAADLSGVSTEDFANLVRQASKEQLTEAMNDEAVRTKVLDEVFDRMGSRYRGGRSTDAVIHWKILDRPGGGYDLYENVLADGTCTVNKDKTREPRVTISLSGPEFLRLASGNGSPTMMFFSGKLKLAGDIGFAAALSSLFDIPKG